LYEHKNGFLSRKPDLTAKPNLFPVFPTLCADGMAASMTAIFNTSMLHAHLEDGGGINGWLLGDRGCGIQPYLLTPFRPDSVSTQPQRRYQKAHTKTRNTIETPMEG